MTTKLQNLVTEAVSLDREINEKAERLKQIKARLVAEARRAISTAAWVVENQRGDALFPNLGTQARESLGRRP